MAVGSTPFLYIFYRLMHWGGERIEKSPIKLNFWHCGGMKDIDNLLTRVQAWIRVSHSARVSGCWNKERPSPHFIRLYWLTELPQSWLPWEGVANNFANNFQCQRGPSPPLVSKKFHELFLSVGWGRLMIWLLAGQVTPGHTVLWPLILLRREKLQWWTQCER